MIESLYEELIYLDEIAGELDPESNRKIDARREQIKQELIALGEKV
jgi:ABC-type phosphate transport system ATPase subunit